MQANKIRAFVESSDRLDADIASRFIPYKYSTNKDNLTQILCDISFQHANSIRILYGFEMDNTATAILRMQFESVVRLIWIHFCAKEYFIESYAGSFSADKPPKDFPSVTEMIARIKQSGVKGPGESLEEFKNLAWIGMNNHIHNGYLAFSRHVNNYPEDLVIQIISNSNALNIMTAMILARLNRSQADVDFVKDLQLNYREVMPELRFN